MQINIIAAMDKDGTIGKNNKLLWHLPDDLKHFKKITTGHPIIMGRKTFQSIGKALPNRTNIILTRQKNFQAENCIVSHSINNILQLTKTNKQIFIIGGGEIYNIFLPLTNRIFLTLVETQIIGDTFFPLEKINNWTEVSNTFHPKDKKHQFSFYFKTLIKP